MSNPLVIGIAGGTGSGKTTITNAIVDALGRAVTVLDHDAYYKDQSALPQEERLKINYDHPDALDNDLLVEQIEQLRRGEAVQKPAYDFAHHVRMEETLTVNPAHVVIIEGILTLAIPAVRKSLDLKIFVDTASDIRVIRRIRRDMESRGRTFAQVREQYYATVRPMHIAYVEPSKQYADLIVPEGGQNHPAVGVLVGRIRDFLRERAS